MLRGIPLKSTRKQETETPALPFKSSVSNNLEINWHVSMSLSTVLNPLPSQSFSLSVSSGTTTHFTPKPSDGGIVERALSSLNTQFFSSLPGYVSSNVQTRSPKGG